MAETTSITVESTLKALLSAKKYSALKDVLVTMNGADIAAVFEEMEDARIPLLFRLSLSSGRASGRPRSRG